MVTLSTGSGVVVGWRRKTDMTWRLRVNRFPIHSKACGVFRMAMSFRVELKVSQKGTKAEHFHSVSRFSAIVLKNWLMSHTKCLVCCTVCCVPLCRFLGALGSATPVLHAAEFGRAHIGTGLEARENGGFRQVLSFRRGCWLARQKAEVSCKT